jgi:hypothetical protein
MDTVPVVSISRELSESHIMSAPDATLNMTESRLVHANLPTSSCHIACVTLTAVHPLSRPHDGRIVLLGAGRRQVQWPPLLRCTDILGPREDVEADEADETNSEGPDRPSPNMRRRIETRCRCRHRRRRVFFSYSTYVHIRTEVP